MNVFDILHACCNEQIILPCHMFCQFPVIQVTGNDITFNQLCFN